MEIPQIVFAEKILVCKECGLVEEIPPKKKMFLLYQKGWYCEDCGEKLPTTVDSIYRKGN